MQPLFVGVDGGGSTTRAVLMAADGRELARARGGPALVDPGDPAAVVASLTSVLQDLLHATAPLARSPARPLHLAVGLAGAGRESERAAVRVALELAGIASSVVVMSDAEAALHDAFGAGAGVLLIAGTGSIAWARAAGGAAVRVGGWGALLGDEGSGYAIGLEALRAVTRAADGRAGATALSGDLLRAAGCSQAEDLVRSTANMSKRDIAALAPLVLDCAAAGDPAAVRIRDDSVAALAELFVAAASRARLHEPDAALSGGLIAPDGPLRRPVAAAIAHACPRARIQENAIDPARGAALLARAAAVCVRRY